MRMGLRAVAVWGLILVLAILNGAVREAWLLPELGRGGALVASGLLLAAVVLAVAWLAIRWLGPPTPVQAWRIGAFWLVLTLLFEFGFGALVQHRSWAEMLSAYSFRDGNLWPLVLLVVLAAPALARRARG